MPKKTPKKVDIKPVIEMIAEVANDRTVPKNIRAAAEEAKASLEGTEEIEVRISAAIGVLDDIINDPNMPLYTRTQIWNIVSMLEQIRRDL